MAEILREERGEELRDWEFPNIYENPAAASPHLGKPLQTPSLCTGWGGGGQDFCREVCSSLRAGHFSTSPWPGRGIASQAIQRKYGIKHYTKFQGRSAEILSWFKMVSAVFLTLPADVARSELVKSELVKLE